jgi:hypothetical protein
LKTTKIIDALMASLAKSGITATILEEYDANNVPVAQVELPGIEDAKETSDSDPRLAAVREFINYLEVGNGFGEITSPPGGYTACYAELGDQRVELAWNGDDNGNIVVAFYETDD